MTSKRFLFLCFPRKTNTNVRRWGRRLTKREDRVFCSDVREKETATIAAYNDEDDHLAQEKDHQSNGKRFGEHGDSGKLSLLVHTSPGEILNSAVKRGYTRRAKILEQ